MTTPGRALMFFLLSCGVVAELAKRRATLLQSASAPMHYSV